MMCIIYESYGIGCADIVCIICTYILCYGGRDPYCTGGVRRQCYINISGGRDRYDTGGGGRQGIYHISGGRDPYCTGGVRRWCYDIHICVTLQIIENE